MEPPILLAVPNVSEGRREPTIAEIARAFEARGDTSGGTPGRAGEDPPTGGARLLDVHSDADHHRSVFTIAGRPGELADAVLAGAKVAVEQIDVVARAGAEPAEIGPQP